MSKLKVKRLTKDAKLPTRATEGSACFDLYADTFEGVEFGNKYDRTIVGTGIAVEIPKNHVLLIFSRSGHGFKYGLRLANCVGVIDSDYRGEIKVALQADIDSDLILAAGDRIAQALLIPYPEVEIIEVEELGETDRGICGFGSSGN